jgi:hypothetical protein
MPGAFLTPSPDPRGVLLRHLVPLFDALPALGERLGMAGACIALCQQQPLSGGAQSRDLLVEHQQDFAGE